jgi:hypothetical protein
MIAFIGVQLRQYSTGIVRFIVHFHRASNRFIAPENPAAVPRSIVGTAHSAALHKWTDRLKNVILAGLDFRSSTQLKVTSYGN